MTRLLIKGFGALSPLDACTYENYVYFKRILSLRRNSLMGSILLTLTLLLAV